MTKNKSLANIRSNNLIEGKHEENLNERLKQLEHQREWKKKNYFGGFDSSDESSLSYKSDESKDLSEYMEKPRKFHVSGVN